MDDERGRLPRLAGSAHPGAGQWVTGVKEAIEAAGATRVFLPPYSPDFNPIEQVFAKLKAILRKVGARTIDDLWAAIADAIELFPPAECANFFANSGYEPH